MRKSVTKSRKPPAQVAEDVEREFWATADLTDHFDVGTATVVRFPNLRPSTTTISLRLPQGMLDELRGLANARDVPYQSLLKVFLRERLDAERQRPAKVTPKRRIRR